MGVGGDAALGLFQDLLEGSEICVFAVPVSVL
jgi:hypothetical protein